jgi:hypothetical protein
MFKFFIIIFLCSFKLFSNDTSSLNLKSFDEPEKKWGLDFDFGTGLSKGNSDYLTFNTKLKTYKKFKYFTGSFLANVDYMEVSNIRETNMISLSPRLDYIINNNWSWVFSNTSFYDELKNIRFKNIIGTGPFYTAKYRRARFGTSIIFGYDYEKNTSATQKTVLAALKNDLLITINDNTSFSLSFNYYPLLKNFRDYILELNSNIKTALVGEWLKFFFEISASHDSRPVIGSKRNDIKLLSGLSFSISGD